jgi:NAD(P)-dependent dehydrogenase (short-subunit alcohol dehydrogenase family)
MTDFSSARILVTGAASGIGASTVQLLAERGARIVAMDRDASGLAQFAGADHLTGDVADPALWTDADLTGLTHAVINAGIGAGGPIEDMDFTEWRRVMDVNLDGAFLSLQAAMRAIRATGKGGAIVVTASAAGMKPEPGIGAYAASKAAVIQLARVAAKEGAAARIRVNAIAPGGVETPIWSSQPFFQELVERHWQARRRLCRDRRHRHPARPFRQAAEIARRSPFLLSDDAAFTTAPVLLSDGGYSL